MAFNFCRLRYESRKRRFVGDSQGLLRESVSTRRHAEATEKETRQSASVHMRVRVCSRVQSGIWKMTITFNEKNEKDTTLVHW